MRKGTSRSSEIDTDLKLHSALDLYVINSLLLPALHPTSRTAK